MKMNSRWLAMDVENQLLTKINTITLYFEFIELVWKVLVQGVGSKHRLSRNGPINASCIV